MTGYTAKIRDIGLGVISFEIKSVNSRYLDFQFRLGDELRALEPTLRERFAARINRGKIECRVVFTPANAERRPLLLNTDLLARLKEFEAQVRRELPSASPLTVGEALRWPGVLNDDSAETGDILPACLDLAAEALDDLMASRLREGEKLAAIILDKAAAVRECVQTIAPWIETAQVSYQEKLKARLVEAMGTADNDRLLQEAVLFAARADIAEELARLTTHIGEVGRVVRAGGACGKRLDFLMQELNREANTIGSKSMVFEVSQASVELKLFIEQMREQAQNIE